MHLLFSIAADRADRFPDLTTLMSRIRFAFHQSSLHGLLYLFGRDCSSSRGAVFVACPRGQAFFLLPPSLPSVFFLSFVREWSSERDL